MLPTLRAQRFLRHGPADRAGARARDRERGQVLVLFALAAVAMIAMAGLVLDGGDTFAQRRDQQNGADVASLAGANAYMNTSGGAGARTNAARAAAQAAAVRNGYTHGTDGTAVTVNITLASSGAYVKVDISRPHVNAFSRVMGFESWPVSVTSTAIAGTIDTAVGAAPWIMHVTAFNTNGTPKYTASNPTSFGEANGDYPISGLDLAWTDFNGANNVNTNEVRGIIDGSNIVSATVETDQYIGQHNNGNHTALYDEVNTHLAGTDVPIPIVGPCPNPNPNPDGCFKGWAMFHVISASGGSSKTITGYFLDDFVDQPLTVGECTPSTASCGEIDTGNPFGGNVVRLFY